MRSKYREARILHALDEISKDKEASKKLWDDICKVTAEHIRSWLDRNERPHHRVEGIIIEKNGYLRMLCPKCKSVHPATVTFCGQCGVQLQDTWLKKKPGRRTSWDWNNTSTSGKYEPDDSALHLRTMSRSRFFNGDGQ
jgi:hypothetical protein